MAWTRGALREHADLKDYATLIDISISLMRINIESVYQSVINVQPAKFDFKPAPLVSKIVDYL